MNKMDLEDVIVQALRLLKEGNAKEAEQLLQETNDKVNESHLKVYHGSHPMRRHDDV